MTQTEAKKIFIKHAGPTVESWGFKQKKVRRAEAIYVREKQNGFERFGVSTLNYYPEVVCRIGTKKRIDSIENILSNINNEFSFDLDINKDDFTIAARKGERQLDLQLSNLEDRDNEKGVIASAEVILDYLENTALPMFSLFDDLREIDKRINGEGENWTSFPEEFSLGRLKPHRRFIIARLSKSEKDFDFFYKKFVNEVNGRLRKNGKPEIDITMQDHFLTKMIAYLKKEIRPIYWNFVFNLPDGNWTVLDDVFVKEIKDLQGRTVGFKLLVNETKLSELSKLTKNQREFLKQLKSGRTEFTTRSRADDIVEVIEQGTTVTIEKYVKTIGKGVEKTENLTTKILY